MTIEESMSDIAKAITLLAQAIGTKGLTPATQSVARAAAEKLQTKAEEKPAKAEEKPAKAEEKPAPAEPQGALDYDRDVKDLIIGYGRTQGREKLLEVLAGFTAPGGAPALNGKQVQPSDWPRLVAALKA